ncbi:MAG: amidohydrolase [Desulfobacter sp.]
MDNDILIFNGLLVTMEPGLPVTADGAVRIQENRISACGHAKDVDGRDAALRIDARGGIIMPGLVNGHTHTPMSMFRGLADDLPLDVWLNQHIFPAEAARVNPESAGRWAAHSCKEMLLAGITCCCDGYFYEAEVAQAMADNGIRAVAAQGVIDFPAPGVPDPGKNIAQALACIDAVRALPSRIVPSIFCHSPYTCSAETLKAAKNAARDAGVLFQIHTAETRNEPGMIRGFGSRSVVAYLDELGILDASTLLVHAVWVDEADMGVIRDRGCGVVHCPESNMKLASGIAPVPGMLAAGITVGLGTDGCASNNDHDLFGEMDTAAKLHKVACMDPCVMDARTCVRMATSEGARAIGLGRDIGTLAPGKLADIIIVNRDALHMTPMSDVYSGLVYAARASDVSMVMVDGMVRVQEGRLV